MSTVLHPAGPEPERTYWWRRALVVLAAVLLVVLLVSLVVNGTSSGSAVAVAPTPSVVAPPSAVVTPYTVPSDTESPTATPTPSPSDTPSASGTPSATASPSTSASATPGATTKAKAKAEAKAKPAGPVTCAPAQLRTTLTGGRTLKPKQPDAFRLSLINGTGATCVVKVTPADFELKIYSGQDRIWSSDDCPALVKPISKKLPAEEAVEWAMTWNGRRSAQGCTDRPEIPRAGTYVATAQLAGGKPVQLRMILRG